MDLNCHVFMSPGWHKVGVLRELCVCFHLFISPRWDTPGSCASSSTAIQKAADGLPWSEAIIRMLNGPRDEMQALAWSLTVIISMSSTIIYMWSNVLVWYSISKIFMFQYLYWDKVSRLFMRCMEALQTVWCFYSPLQKQPCLSLFLSPSLCSQSDVSQPLFISSVIFPPDTTVQRVKKENKEIKKPAYSAGTVSVWLCGSLSNSDKERSKKINK